METFKLMLKIIMTSVLVNNYVLSKFLGICPFLGVSKKLDQASGMGIAVIFVMLLATAATWPIQTYLLDPNGLGYLQTIVFILVIAALVQFVEIVLKKYIPTLHASLGVYLPLITTNCAVLGIALTNVTKEYSLLEGTVNGFATSVGFTIAIVILAGIREKMQYNDVPQAFKGMPIVLVSAGLMAIAFCGFAVLL
jgi:electron transport complex protein RnfA